MIWLNNWSHNSCLHLCNIVNWKISRFRWYISPGDTIERTHFWPLSRSSLRYLGRAWLTPEYNIRAQVWCRYNKTWWCLSEVLGHVLAKLWSISVCLSSLQCYLYNVWSFQSKLLEIVSPRILTLLTVPIERYWVERMFLLLKIYNHLFALICIKL